MIWDVEPYSVLDKIHAPYYDWNTSAMTAYLVCDRHGHVVFGIFDTNIEPAIFIPCPVSDYWIHKTCERTTALSSNTPEGVKTWHPLRRIKGTGFVQQNFSNGKGKLKVKKAGFKNYVINLHILESLAQSFHKSSSFGIQHRRQCKVTTWQFAP